MEGLNIDYDNRLVNMIIREKEWKKSVQGVEHTTDGMRKLVSSSYALKDSEI